MNRYNVIYPTIGSFILLPVLIETIVQSVHRDRWFNYNHIIEMYEDEQSRKTKIRLSDSSVHTIRISANRLAYIIEEAYKTKSKTKSND